MRLKNKVALITGAAQGLGRACCLKFAAEGAIVVAADIKLEGAQETAAKINANNGQAIAVRVNVADEQDTLKMAQEVIKTLGRVDILVNNAAIFYGLPRRPFYEIPVEEWNLVMDVNIKGIWLVTKAIFPAMKETGGKIINIASEVFFTGSGKSGLINQFWSINSLLGGVL